jgi:hypothetical protein
MNQRVDSLISFHAESSPIADTIVAGDIGMAVMSEDYEPLEAHLA